MVVYIPAKGMQVFHHFFLLWLPHLSFSIFERAETEISHFRKQGQTHIITGDCASTF